MVTGKLYQKKQENSSSFQFSQRLLAQADGIWMTCDFQSQCFRYDDGRINPSPPRPEELGQLEVLSTPVPKVKIEKPNSQNQL